MSTEIFTLTFIGSFYFAAFGVLRLEKQWHETAQTLFSVATLLTLIRLVLWVWSNPDGFRAGIAFTGAVVAIWAAIWFVRKVETGNGESEPKLIIRVKKEWVETIEHINKDDPFIYHQSKIRLTKCNDGYHAWANVLVVFDNQRSEAMRVEGVFVSIVIPNRDEVDLVGECRPDYDGLPNRLQGERIEASTLTHTYHLTLMGWVSPADFELLNENCFIRVRLNTLRQKAFCVDLSVDWKLTSSLTGAPLQEKRAGSC